MRKPHLIGALCAGVFNLATMSSHAALIDQGSGLIYDDVLDITWTANAGLNGSVSGITWGDATTWANSLVFGGSSNWRLPNMDLNGDANVADCSVTSEMSCRDNELGYMFYQNLGGTPPLSGNQTVGGVTITNIAGEYWSSTAASASEIWVFSFDTGVQIPHSIGGSGPGASTTSFAWAVTDGKVSAVPLPAAVWLFGSGLLGLAGAARRKKTA